MKNIVLASLCLFLFLGNISAQEEVESGNKEYKTIIIKIIDANGKVTTRVITGDDTDIEGDIGKIEGNLIKISEDGDSITVDIEIEDEDGVKRIKKQLILGDSVEDEFDLMEIEEFGGGPHFFDKIKNCHPEEMNPFGDGESFLFFADKGPKKAKLGVYIEDVPKGVKVTRVIENSAAYSVGLLAGDVIIKIDDNQMTNVEELQREVGGHQPGDIITIKLKRNGKTKKFDVRLNSSDEPRNFPFSQMSMDKDFGPKFKNRMQHMMQNYHKGMEKCEKEMEKCERIIKKECKEYKGEFKKLKMKHKKHFKEMQEQDSQDLEELSPKED